MLKTKTLEINKSKTEKQNINVKKSRLDSKTDIHKFFYNKTIFLPEAQFSKHMVEISMRFS